MKQLPISLLLAVSCYGLNAHACEVCDNPAHKQGYPISPVSFTSVKVTDDFWEPRLKTNREVTIPLAFKKCEETERYENFIKAANPSPEYKFKGRAYDDTDVYKTIEGASYSIQAYPNKKLEKYIDSILVIVAAAQEPDGYLFTCRTMNPSYEHRYNGKKRWDKVETLSHEFYNLGHMIEGAVAYYQATGKRNFLDIAIKYADCVDRESGDAPGKQAKIPGHQIAEMALAKLYTVTGERRYLNLAKYFLDKRGYTHNRQEYNQSHKPIVDQKEAVGHAVRAVYMYSGIADVAALTNDRGYVNIIDTIWDNTVSKKLYLTGGIGARHGAEAFGDNYELPNHSAYCETCAAIGNVYWNYRMFLLKGDAKYYDVLERTLYNGLISGVSLDGGEFFYSNPLASEGEHKRSPWFNTSCCPTNISRFIPSLPGYVYAIDDKDVYVNLYMGNTSELQVNGRKINLKQTTGYPWNGNVRLEITKGKQNMALKLRIPGWVRGEVVPSDLYTYADGKQMKYTIRVNGQPIESKLEKGYFTISRTWGKGDVVEIDFDMCPRIVKAHKEVDADKGRVAIERGPIVYCAEWPDNKDFKISSILLPVNPEIQIIDKPDMLCGIKVLETSAQSLFINKSGLLEAESLKLKLIPYNAWNHRGSGDMMVWLPQDVSVVKTMKK